MGDHAYVHRRFKSYRMHVNKQKRRPMFKDGYRQASKNAGLYHMNDDVLARILPKGLRVVKGDHRTCECSVIESILGCLSLPNLDSGAIACISRGTGIPESILRDWRWIALIPILSISFQIVKAIPRNEPSLRTLKAPSRNSSSRIRLKLDWEQCGARFRHW
jgi:hypothetical protein